MKKGVIGAIKCLPLSMILKKSWQSDAVPGDWERGSFVLIFKKGRKEDSGNYQPVSLPAVNTWKDHGTGSPRSCARARGGWRGDLGQPAQLHQGQVLPTPSVGWPSIMEQLYQWARAADVIYLDTVPHNVVPLNSRVVDLMGGQLHPKDSGQWPGVPMNFSGVPQGSVIGPVLSNVLVNDIEGFSAP